MVWEICLIKCDFTAEIQPQKMVSGTFASAVWLKKQGKVIFIIPVMLAKDRFTRSMSQKDFH